MNSSASLKPLPADLRAVDPASRQAQRACLYAARLLPFAACGGHEKARSKAGLVCYG